MIEAVVALIDGNGDQPPPPELSLAWDARRWHALPEAGGLYDQDARTMHRMGVFLNVHDTVSRFRSLHGADIHTLTDSERKIIGSLRKDGLI